MSFLHVGTSKEFIISVFTLPGLINTLSDLEVISHPPKMTLTKSKFRRLEFHIPASTNLQEYSYFSFYSLQSLASSHSIVHVLVE